MLPARPVQEEITGAIEAQMDSLVLEMEWEKGDMVINDNLGLAHYAVPGTQGDRKKVCGRKQRSETDTDIYP